MYYFTDNFVSMSYSFVADPDPHAVRSDVVMLDAVDLQKLSAIIVEHVMLVLVGRYCPDGITTLQCAL
jgi:hypothetical protein